MNCTRIEELLPLYAGGDLAAPEVDHVEAHLAACENCRALAAVFAESQDWLQRTPTPEFDEDYFAGIRTAVQQEIVRLNQRTSWWVRFAVRWRPLVAASCVLLAWLVWVWYSQPNTLPQEITRSGDKLQTLPQPPEPLTGAGAGNTDLVKRREPHAALPKQKRPNARPSQDNLLQEDSATGRAVDVATTSQTSETAAIATLAEMTRMEIQTADPNIRIIWLTPKPTGSVTNPTEPLTK